MDGATAAPPQTSSWREDIPTTQQNKNAPNHDAFYIMWKSMPVGACFCWLLPPCRIPHHCITNLGSSLQLTTACLLRSSFWLLGALDDAGKTSC